MDPEQDTEGEVELLDPNAQQEAAPQGEADPAAEPPGDGEAADDADGVVVSLGDELVEEPDHEHETPVIRTIRKQNRDLVREKRNLEREKRDLQSRLDAASAPTAPVAATEKPTLEGCDYDADKFEEKLTAWTDARRQADERKRQGEEAQQAAQADWKKRLDAYGTAKAALKVRDYESAEDTTREALSVVQQGVIVNGAENPALMVYALGMNPKKLAELAAIKDPVRFAFAVAKLETQLKVTPRKQAPPPERSVKSAGSGVALSNQHLERLRETALKTGNMTEYLAAKRKQTAKA